MDIRQLRYFIAIVEERKISAAAERLHISQPPLSQHLKTMEEELGSKLVERSGKFLEITEAGKVLYKYALQMDHLMEEAKMEVKEVRMGVNGKLTIGINTFSVVELPEILLQFQKQYPKVTYKVQQNESAQLCKLVRDRVVELAIIRMPLELDHFSVIHLCTEPFYFITSEKQKQFDYEVSLDKIQNYPLILPSTEGLGVHYLILEAFSRFQLHPNIMGECSDITLLMDLVSSEFGGSIVPETILKRHKGYPIQACKISDTKLSASVGLIWLKNHYLSKSAQNFINLIKKTTLR
ncbi:HTH-type transcriptional regulator BsdA [Paenibacillus larvae subsp. larvae]|uniref:HTH-type transcriptional regulator BsdA n=1 Tax=Paenibacillus larvae subsp. larvae TaxID=147375 RepID=A0A2L1U0N6_9BACL|nr:LysR family transcriptional regulator [Paenibacillus larvae]AQT83342.1 LysR family transcriptional regulator [Paenibacillus larvae subsp. pulvifaciens]AQZ48483.1 LysR family transcriptional regulator [Paenibacillus larvae subsp. pulvifaciens]AVF26497.1 HTH-type transcriptional regulator BsdA [Paenibacillus larvae subsp. larvae]AVF31273.1 HTH-type transcriptional regulator BsdA [Paenibacillus larvae subsp. larvae]MBH0341415.1 LysR family transcriptional regulator [Paenibacillus larvae]